MDKDGFVIYKSFYEPIKELSLEHKGLLFAAIFEYQINDKIIDLPSECRMAFKFFRNQFELDNKKYQKICEKRALAGKKSAEKRALEQNEQMPTKPTDKEKEKEKEKEKDKDKEKDYTDNLNNIFKEKKEKEKKDFSEVQPHEQALEKEKIKKFSESNQFGPTTSQKPIKNVAQVFICENFRIDFNDEFFKPYDKCDAPLRQSLNSWLVKNKLNQMVGKSYICRLIVNFAKKQGKYSTLLGIDATN